MEQAAPEAYPTSNEYQYVPVETQEALPDNDAPWVGDVVRSSRQLVISMYGPDSEDENYREVKVEDWAPDEEEYTLSNDISVWMARASADNLEVVSRGNLWKLHNGEEVEFEGVDEEAQLHLKTGNYAVVERTDDNAWAKEALLDAIEAGDVDLFRVGPPLSLVGEPMSREHTAVYFKDREFGDRIANVVLAGFSREYRRP
jgi:hypothetical protein